MTKLRFEFVIKPAPTDNKTNVINITSITTEKNEMFIIPDEFQHIDCHNNLKNNSTFLKAKNTLKLLKRNASRKIWITLDDETRKDYVDDEGNMHFKDYLLEETIPDIQAEKTVKPTTDISVEVLQRILDNFAQTTNTEPKSEVQNLKKISGNFVIEKFTCKNANVRQWMEIFENECSRLGLNQDVEKIEILRLFLEGPCVDWYKSMLIKLTLDSDWGKWKNIFFDTFADKGWTPVRYAIEFKYINGSLLEYALKKERLLLEINKLLDKKTLIDLIVVGLPSFISDNIDRNILKETEDLFNEIRGLEYLVKPKTSRDREKVHLAEKAREKLPCKICEKERKGVRYHSESSCWFRKKGETREQLRTVNNSELEVVLNENSPKN
jgi:hypothetical protein